MPTAFITGGTSGIGKATAQLLHARGYRVAVTGSTAASVTAARADLPDDVLVIEADARSHGAVEAAVEAAGAAFGSLDAVLLNAGISRPVDATSVDAGEIADQLAVNFTGQYIALQRALPLLNDGGSIVITAGVGIRRGIPGGTLTSAARGALLSMMPALVLDLAPRRIRVNAVSPGAIDTPIWDRLGASADARAATAASIPFGRFGTADEVAELVAFLMSDAAAYITGQEIAIAGGW